MCVGGGGISVLDVFFFSDTAGPLEEAKIVPTHFHHFYYYSESALATAAYPSRVDEAFTRCCCSLVQTQVTTAGAGGGEVLS